MHLFSFFFSLATTAIAGSVNCPPESYIGMLPGTCIFSNNVTYWTAAEATCAELGGQLACPQSDAENALVSLPPNGYSCRAPHYSWLGATYDVFSKKLDVAQRLLSNIHQMGRRLANIQEVRSRWHCFSCCPPPPTELLQSSASVRGGGGRCQSEKKLFHSRFRLGR